MPLLANAQSVVAGAPGTGDIALGLAVAGGRSWSDAGAANGQVYSYRIEDGANWEIGSGTYSTTGNRLARTTILASSNNGSAVPFGSAAVVSQIALPGDLQTPLGFTPVQQGGGAGNDGQPHKLIVSWDGAGPKLQVDALDLGRIWVDASGAVSFGETGYERLPNGLIVQWGSAVPTIDGSGNGSVTYPLNFPSASYRPVAVGGDPGTSPGGTLSIGAQTTSGFPFKVTNGVAGFYRINWMAWGR